MLAQQGLSKDPLSRPNGVAPPLITKRNNQHNFLSQHLPHGKTFLPQVDQPTNQQNFSRAADATLNHTCQDCAVHGRSQRRFINDLADSLKVLSPIPGIQL
jgi:hypothetical protein